MRVDRLHVLLSSKDDTEVKTGGDAIVAKSSNTCNNIFKYEFTSGVAEPKLTKMDYLNDFELSRSVGVYLIGHISSNFGVAYNAESLAQMLKDLLGNDFAKIQKLCLIICAVAAKPSKKKPLDIVGDDKVNIIKISARYSKVLRLLRALSEKGCRPMIAGYDNFVSIFPAMGENECYNDASGNDINASQHEYNGKKIFSDNYTKYFLTKNSYEVGKRVFYIQGGKVQVASPALWSDKP